MDFAFEETIVPPVQRLGPPPGLGFQDDDSSSASPSSQDAPEKSGKPSEISNDDEPGKVTTRPKPAGLWLLLVVAFVAALVLASGLFVCRFIVPSRR